MILVERLTYFFAKHAIVTNESYKEIAMRRGHKREEDVTVVRSGPNLSKLKVGPAKPEIKKGFKYLVGYIGVMGKQEGIDLLLSSIDYIVNEKKRKDIRFCIMGGGPSLDELRSLNETRAFIQPRLPRMVLISPLCANKRKGWANDHVGNVFVLKRECTSASPLVK